MSVTTSANPSASTSSVLSRFQDLGNDIYLLDKEAKQINYFINSVIYCVNYAFGHFKEAVYGQTEIKLLRRFTPIVGTAIYIRNLNECLTGQLFLKRTHVIVASLSKIVSDTLSNVIKIQTYVLSFFDYNLPFSASTWSRIKTIKQFTLGVTFFIYAADLAQQMYHDPVKRTKMNLLKLTWNASLSGMSIFPCFSKDTKATTWSIVALNVSTVALFTINRFMTTISNAH